MDMNVLHNISYGMYIVSSVKNDAFNGQIANTVFQITSQPATIAVSINKNNLTHEYIAASRIFTVSVLAEETPLPFIGKFGFKSGRNSDKFKDTKFKTLLSGCPAIMENSLCYLEVKVSADMDCGTHTIFIGELVSSEILASGRPMTYDYYHRTKRGTTPSSAPTYIRGEFTEKKGGVMQKYRCEVCNYIYDPAAGDPDNGVQQGTPFEKLPDDWVCPVCGAGKDQFVKEG